jgi:hypothetical protein
LDSLQGAAKQQDPQLQNSGLGSVQVGRSAGDVKVVNVNRQGDVTHQYFAPSPKPESQLQAEFVERTNIWAPKDARKWLEQLLDEEGFTVRELALAWKAGSLGWSAKTNERRIVTPWFEPYGAGLMIAVMLTLQMAIFIVCVLTPQHRSAALYVVLIGGTATCFTMLWMINNSMVTPRRVAIRVRQATETRG